MHFFPSSSHVDTAIWTLTKCMKKKLDTNYTRMLRAILNKSWRQHLQISSYTTIIKTMQIRWTRHVEHCWRSKDELISNTLLWIPSHGRAKAGWPDRTYIQQLCANIGYSLKDLLEAMDDRDGWQERVREIWASSTTRWWCQLTPD